MWCQTSKLPHPSSALGSQPRRTLAREDLPTPVLPTTTIRWPEICKGRGDWAWTDDSKSNPASSHESLMVTEEDLHRFQSSCGLTQIVNPRPSNLLLYKLSASEWVHKGGDLLRSVPFRTVWHQKMCFWFLKAGAKSSKLWLVYVKTITKNMPCHLPGFFVQK